MKKLTLLCFIIFLCFDLANAKKENDGKENTIRIINYNVRNGKGMDEVTNYQRTADVIKSLNPDVVAIQELDSVTTRSNGVDVLAELSDLTGLYSVYGASIDYKGGKYGIGLLSKEEPVSWEKLALPGREEKRSALVVEFPRYVLCVTHLSLTDEDRMASIEIINSAIENYQNKPIFLSGDLNAHPESAEMIKLEEKWTVLTDPSIYTFPADVPDETLDYICVYKDNGQEYFLRQSEVVDEPMASDHRPVFVDVEF